MLSTALVLNQQVVSWRLCQLQVLYNKEELPLTELCGAPACDLQLFK